MEIRTINETWTGRKVIATGGRYLRLLQTVNPVDVELAINGQYYAKLQAVQAGAWVNIPSSQPAFTDVAITTGGNENVIAIISDGEVGYDRASADITDRAGRLMGVFYGNLGQVDQQAIGGRNLLTMTDRGYTYGANYKSTTNLAVNTADTIFSAASNLNGAILWDADMILGDAGVSTPRAALVAHTAAPADFATGDHIGAADIMTFVQTIVRYQRIRREKPIFIPAGKGVYVIAAQADGGAIAHRRANYTLL